MKSSPVVFAVNKSCLFAVLLAVAPAAHAVLVSASTTTAASFRTCIAGVSGCDSITGRGASSDGLPGAAAAHVAASAPGFGSAEASVSLSGTIGAPVIVSRASSLAGARVNTTSFALQSYTYTGTAAATRTFGGTLTYSQTSTGSYPADVGGGVNAGFDVFTLPVSAIEAGDTAADNLGALATLSDLPGYTLLGSQSVFDPATTPNGSATLGVTVTLDPGEVVWILALLQTPAVNGGEIDASHTFITGWDDPSNLVPASVSGVPDPGTAALLGLGLASMAGFGRRTRCANS
jgi:hypothetical protein